MRRLDWCGLAAAQLGLAAALLGMAGPVAAVETPAAGMETPTRAGIPPADSLTVEEAVHLVLRDHPEVREARQGVEAAAARVRQSESAYYPEAAAEAAYWRLDPVPTLTMPGQGTFQFYPENNYDVHLDVHQTLLDFGRRATGVALARTGEQSAGDNVELVRSRLAYQTIGVCHAILFLEQNVVVLDEQIAALNRHLEAARQKVQAGTATDFDALTTEVRVAAAQSQRIDVARTLENQRTMLAQLLGLPPDTPVALRGGFSDVAPPPPPADSLLALARERLPELRLSRSAEAAAESRRRLAALGDKPSLNAGVQLGVKNGYVPDLTELKANWVARAGVAVPLFNGHRTRSRVAEAEANLEAARARTRALERRTEAEVRRAVTDLEASRDRMQTAQVQVAQAEQAVATAKSRYEAGVATNLDVLDAETSLSNARLARLGARYEYVTSRYALEKATGGEPW